MDEHLGKVSEEFTTQRLSLHGQNETEEVNGAYMELRALVERLSETLTEEQRLLLRDCENAYRVSIGETERFFYKAGFSDAINFLLHFGEES